MARARWRSISVLSRRLVVLGAVALIAGMLAPGSEIALAATPGSGAVAPPDGTAVSWTGTVAGSTGVGDTCPPPSPLCDHFNLTVNVAQSYWDTHFGGVTVHIDWPDAGNDVDLYVYQAGTLVGSSTAGSGNFENVNIANASGVYEARVIPSTVVGPSDYNGKATFHTSTGPPQGPVRQTGGLRFGPPTIIDAQRTEGEPLNYIDRNGNYWESGPFGTTTQQSFIHRSTDGGDQFNIVSPIALRADAPPGGGDTEIVVDDQGFAYWSDLEGLVNFDCAVSNDNGNTWRKNTSCVQSGDVDRQWMAMDNGSNTTAGAAGAADNTVFFAYHTAPGIFVYSSPGSTGPADPVGGFAYTNSASVPTGLAADARCGEIRFDPFNRNLYYPCGVGNQVRITVGHVNAAQRTGIVYTSVLLPASPGGGSTSASLFPDVAVDAAGHVYAVWIDGNDNNVYYSYLNTPGTANFATSMATANWSAPVRINGNDANSNIMPWVQGGVSGTLAVAWYGSPDPTDSDSMTSWFNNRVGATAFKWYGYASILQSANTGSPTIYQQRFTEKPMNYGQVCTGGIGCTITNGDRSMADFFGFVADPADGSIRIVYNDTTNQHHGAQLNEVRQLGGPTLTGATINKPDPANPMSDPAGDAQVPHYGPACPGACTTQTRFDFRNVNLSKPNANTLRVQLTMENLDSFQPPTGKSTAVWLTRFEALSINDAPQQEESYRIFYVGAQSVAGQAPTFFTGSGTVSQGAVEGNGCQIRLPDECKIVMYPVEATAAGTSNVTGNVFTIDVPLVDGFGGAAGTRPIKGNTLYNVSAYSFGRNANSDLYTDIDSTRPFDFSIAATGPVCTITGTDAPETLRGTTGNDVICAMGGNDTVFGNSGADTIFGGDGNDVIYGGPGADSMDGQGGNDTLLPGPGNDPKVDGGGGTNGVNYSDATAGVTVKLAAPQTATGGSGNDTLANISNVSGSSFIDSLTGNTGRNELDGQAGNDAIDGRAGNDVLIGGQGTDSLDGGADIDTADYFTAPAGATVNLGTGSTSNDGYGTTDTLTKIEDVKGSNAGGDHLFGSTGNNKLYGFAGSDALDGKEGTDLCDGGAGAGDTAANCETTLGVP